MKVQLTDIRIQQDQLDSRIFRLHQTSREQTTQKRILALLVELGELANETRCFKFWSLKGPNTQEIIAQEYSDGLHFFLSLGIDLKDDTEHLESVCSYSDPTQQFLFIYQLVSKLLIDFTTELYRQAFSEYLGLAQLLGMSGEDILNHYLSKNATNHQRQDEQY